MSRIDTTNVMNPRIRRAIESLPEPAVDYLLKQGDIRVKTEPYYSKVRLQAVVTGSGPWTYTLAAATGANALQAFGYALNDSGSNITVAGLPSTSYTATYAETNLQKKGETNSNEFVFVDGLSFMLLPNSEGEILQQAIGECFMSIALNGQENAVKMGSPIFWGGGGGIFGGGASKLAPPHLRDTRAIQPGFFSNGLPSAMDYRQLDDVILWAPKPWGDSDLAVRIEIARSVSFTAAARTADASPALHVAAFTPVSTAAASGTFVEAMVLLHAVQIGPRGRNR